MLPRLEAERELKEINAMSVAFGGGRPFERQRHIGRLRRIAAGATKAAKPTPAMLAAMGIGVTIVPALPAPRSGEDANRLGEEISAPRSVEGANRLGDPNG